MAWLGFVAPEVLGTFVSPEKTTVTPAADIWSIGCVVYELLAGVSLFGRLPEDGVDDAGDNYETSSAAVQHADSPVDTPEAQAALIMKQQQELVGVAPLKCDVAGCWRYENVPELCTMTSTSTHTRVSIRTK